MTIEMRLETAFRSTDPVRALLGLVQELAREGTSKTEISELLTKYVDQIRTRPDFKDGEEDAVLDVLDALTGWCHPSAELLPDHPAR